MAEIFNYYHSQRYTVTWYEKDVRRGVKFDANKKPALQRSVSVTQEGWLYKQVSAFYKIGKP